MNIKTLNQKISKRTQTVILAILSLLYGFSSIYGSSSAYDYVMNTIIVLLVLTAVWILFINARHSNFASYFVLLLLGFIDHVTTFFKWLFSLNPTTGFIIEFPWLSFILLPCAIYLIIMSISVFIDDGFQFNRECFDLDQLIILFPILMFLTYGTNVLLAVLVIEFVACNYRPIASHFLMFSKSIVIPFTFFRILFQDGLSALNIGNWLLGVLAVYIIILILIDFVDDYKKHKHLESDACEVTNEKLV